MSLTINIKQGPHGTILVVTDTDILGKQFEDTILNTITSKESAISLDLTSSFYQGKDCKVASIAEIQEMAKGAYILHVTGHHSIAALEEYIDKDQIMIIQEVPHAQVHMGE